MILEGMIFICFSFLPYPDSDDVVAEALNLLGSLLNVKKGRDQLKGKFIKNLQKLKNQISENDFMICCFLVQ
jgi:hypothetical protein